MRFAVWATCMWPAWMKWAAAAWPVPSWPAPWCSSRIITSPASLLAKVTRDRLMMDLHVADPRYGFDRHKGYATKAHLDAVAAFGYSPRHRRTFRAPSLFDTIPD